MCPNALVDSLCLRASAHRRPHNAGGHDPDNLNTLGIESLYETFELQRARQLAERPGIHYTPKHGSWLNIAGSN